MLTQQLMDANLDLESRVAVLLVDGEICFGDERDFLIGCLSTKHIPK